MVPNLATRHLLSKKFSPTVISNILFNPFRLCDLYMCQYSASSSVHAMACRQFGTQAIAWHSENSHVFENKHFYILLFSFGYKPSICIEIV